MFVHRAKKHGGRSRVDELPGGQAGYRDYRSGRKAIGYVIAFSCFGFFIIAAVALEKLGYSIYKQGLNPFDNIDISILCKAPEPIQQTTDREDDENDDSTSTDGLHRSRS